MLNQSKLPLEIRKSQENPTRTDSIATEINALSRKELVAKSKELNIDPKFVELVEKGKKIRGSEPIPPFKQYYVDLLRSRIINQLSGMLMPP